MGSTDSPTSPPPRKTRRAYNAPGHAHFLTYSCFGRLPLLSRDRTRQWARNAMEQTRRQLDIALWAYVIMPEHIHILLCPRQPDYEMRCILNALKRPVSNTARHHLEQTRNNDWLKRLTVEYPSRQVFRFWQPGGGFDSNIFQTKTVHSVIDYIHANPVRRGLVEHPTDWEWSSARFWEQHPGVPLQMDNPSA